jgi:hypothetical protein
MQKTVFSAKPYLEKNGNVIVNFLVLQVDILSSKKCILTTEFKTFDIMEAQRKGFKRA